ncbi:tripartite tricarboxylate transporter substrate binding protein [Polynucleobacter kasalickyi]|uniref:Tripartite-type tricarboxylate transporter, receptor component TctC n=1 Tax=Polynucleobacter kasalickyi TaxID=1938817 RepID=A0A1W2C9C0_9BURK|nr:tripartite tricarboxylate transporter substrate binding protein [Polynucleobacter kasalickyi]SMC81288.1 Tripartite-type tricarboxylate transporter, receptor component TctC [Polynucleobacter kasalickyi]
MVLFANVGTTQTKFPNRSITIVVPTPPGGGTDSFARYIAQGLTAKFGQAVIVENKAGGNGSIAAEYVARAAPDGYTILLGYTATHGISPALLKQKYDPIKDFEPIGMIAISPTLLVVNNAIPAKNTKELIAYIQSKPNMISYASAGNGSAPHFAGELFKLATGTDVLHIPYKGAAPAVMDTISGTTQLMFPSVYTAYPQVSAGKLRALGIAGEKRSKVMPQVPTLAEQGLLEVSVEQWYALFAPAKTPQAVIRMLNEEMNLILKDPAVEKKIEDQGAEVETGTPEQLKLFVAKEAERWKNVIAKTKITAN